MPVQTDVVGRDPKLFLYGDLQMRKIKKGMLAAMVGSALFFGGCLSLDGIWGTVLWGSAISVATDFALDNDAVFDLFEDGEPTATDDDGT